MRTIVRRHDDVDLNRAVWPSYDGLSRLNGVGRIGNGELAPAHVAMETGGSGQQCDVKRSPFNASFRGQPWCREALPCTFSQTVPMFFVAWPGCLPCLARRKMNAKRIKPLSLLT